MVVISDNTTRYEIIKVFITVENEKSGYELFIGYTDEGDQGQYVNINTGEQGCLTRGEDGGTIPHEVEDLLHELYEDTCENVPTHFPTKTFKTTLTASTLLTAIIETTITSLYCCNLINNKFK